MKKIEIERKWLVESPKSWSALEELFDGLIDVKRISQNYLKPEAGKESGRVRKTVQGLTGDTETIYHFNRKDFLEEGVHKEVEKEISRSEYEDSLKKNHPDKATVEKTRFVFDYNDQTFELDVFKGSLKGIAILEIELEDIDDKIELPHFLKVKKEVTGEEKYNNFQLANKSLHKGK
jgi:CYTH domain-containing protein